MQSKTAPFTALPRLTLPRVSQLGSPEVDLEKRAGPQADYLRGAGLRKQSYMVGQVRAKREDSHGARY